MKAVSSVFDALAVFVDMLAFRGIDTSQMEIDLPRSEFEKLKEQMIMDVSDRFKREDWYRCAWDEQMVIAGVKFRPQDALNPDGSVQKARTGQEQ
jgi:hypothetical protein